jgi:hypothetical protein
MMRFAADRSGAYPGTGSVIRYFDKYFELSNKLSCDWCCNNIVMHDTEAVNRFREAKNNGAQA